MISSKCVLFGFIQINIGTSRNPATQTALDQISDRARIAYANGK